MPWKGERNPYLIWLSEIILQQTRVEQGWAYFERFRERFPTVETLAAASEDEVLKLWEGLGYYSRARNLHAAARRITDQYDGVFPTTYEEILELKGVGPYTAAAIAAFAYDLPHAVLDGNVFRILARYTGSEQPIDSTAGKRFFATLAAQALDRAQPARYNQAIMDFGATVCVPVNPNCRECPVSSRCQALKTGQVGVLPVKQKRTKKRSRYFQYLVLEAGGQVWLHQRREKDVWQGLYEFVLLETDRADVSWEELLKQSAWPDWLPVSELTLQRRSQSFRQTLSHQYIHATFWEVALGVEVQTPPPFRKTDRQNLRSFAFPKVIDWYLSDKSLYLNLL